MKVPAQIIQISLVLAFFMVVFLYWFYNHCDDCFKKQEPELIIEKITVTCPPHKFSNWVVITTINYPTDAILQFLSFSDWITLVVADKKTPEDWLAHLPPSASNVKFISVQEQEQMRFEIIKLLPYKSYARKNIGYLYAIACGAEVIYETDDDNVLVNPSAGLRIFPTTSELQAYGKQNLRLINPYGLYGEPNIWPRGFPLNGIAPTRTEFWRVKRFKDIPPFEPYVQQGLANLDPDVDAIWRLTTPNRISKVVFKDYPTYVGILPGHFTPYNTQNTIYKREAFWGLLLPYSTNFRVCDIWRGYWVQRLLWDIGGQLVFQGATVEQVRNPHDYLEDFIDEIQLYTQATSLVEFLKKWKSSKTTLFERMHDLAQEMEERGFWKQEETVFMQAWIRDLKRISYEPPTPLKNNFVENKNISIPLKPPKNKVAVCFTGKADRFPIVLTKMDALFSKYLPSNSYDTFAYISTSRSCPADIDSIKTFPFTSSILYNDKEIKLDDINMAQKDPNSPPLHVSKQTYLQQLFALKKCYEMVEEHSKLHNIEYDILVRARTDYVVANEAQLVSLLTSESSTYEDALQSIVIPNLYDDDRVPDFLAWGSMKNMEKYMKRYDGLLAALTTNEDVLSLPPQVFLKQVLTNHNIPLKHVPLDILPEDPNQSQYPACLDLVARLEANDL